MDKTIKERYSELTAQVVAREAIDICGPYEDTNGLMTYSEAVLMTADGYEVTVEFEYGAEYEEKYCGYDNPPETYCNEFVVNVLNVYVFDNNSEEQVDDLPFAMIDFRRAMDREVRYMLG